MDQVGIPRVPCGGIIQYNTILDVEGGRVGARLDVGVDGDRRVLEAGGELEDALVGQRELLHLLVQVGGHGVLGGVRYLPARG